MATQLRSALLSFVPPWIRAVPGFDHGFKYIYAWGLLCDAALEATLQGVIARFPGAGTPTALPRIGRDRRIFRGFYEPADVYVLRLRRWLDDWRHAGNAYTIMRLVRAYLFPHLPLMRVVNANGTWYTLHPDDTLERVKTLPSKNWDWDGDDAAWSRFWVIIYPPAALWQRDGTWNDGETWGQSGQGTWGSTATREEVESIQQIVAAFKSGSAVCENIIVSFDAAAFDPTGTSPPLPDGTWGNWSKLSGGTQVPARDDRAIYWDGVA